MATALIWGATGGIGLALVQTLRAQAWDVLGVARDTRLLREAGIPHYSADVTNESDVAAAALWAAQEAGEVQLWVYAVGAILGKPLRDTDAATWRRILDTNLTGAHLAVTHSLPVVAPGGHLMFLGAYPERIMLPRIGAYAAAKAALDAYVQTLAKELRDRRVTLVRMGAVDTPFWAQAPFSLPRGAHAPADIAAALLRAHQDGHKGVLEL